jgi:hypothetical protein
MNSSELRLLLRHDGSFRDDPGPQLDKPYETITINTSSETFVFTGNGHSTPRRALGSVRLARAGNGTPRDKRCLQPFWRTKAPWRLLFSQGRSRRNAEQFRPPRPPVLRTLDASWPALASSHRGFPPARVSVVTAELSCGVLVAANDRGTGEHVALGMVVDVQATVMVCGNAPRQVLRVYGATHLWTGPPEACSAASHETAGTLAAGSRTPPFNASD